jgi:hypothetical protein
MVMHNFRMLDKTYLLLVMVKKEDRELPTAEN